MRFITQLNRYSSLLLLLACPLVQFPTGRPTEALPHLVDLYDDISSSRVRIGLSNGEMDLHVQLARVVLALLALERPLDHRAYSHAA